MLPLWLSAWQPGSEELVRELRSGYPEDATNAFIGGAITGYALGRIRGGKALAPASAVAFSLLGVGLHWAVRGVQEWRLRLMDQELSQRSTPHSPDEERITTGSAQTSSAQQGGVSTEQGSPQGQRGVKGQDRSVSTREWTWPQWMPIRPATPEDIRKEEERKARIWRERFGDKDKPS